MKKLTAFILALTTASSLWAASSGQNGAEFLDIPAGARAASLGSSYAALATDAYAPVWNPAGLGVLPENELALQHISYLDSVRYEFGSIAIPLFDRAGIALAARDFSSGKIAGMDASGNSMPDFSAHYAAYSLSYGQSVTSALSLGLTGSLISGKLDNVSASAYSFDVGTLYRPNDTFSLALVGANLGNSMTFLKEADSLPASVKLDGAMKATKLLLLTGGVTYRLSGPMSAHAGVELQPVSGFTLRAGYKTDNTTQMSGGVIGLTAGAGINILGQEISYAWVPFGDLGDTHYVSMVFKFGGSRGDDSKSVSAPARSSYSSQASDEDSRPTMTPEKTYKPVYKKAAATTTTSSGKKAKSNKTSLQFSNGYRP